MLSMKRITEARSLRDRLRIRAGASVVAASSTLAVWRGKNREIRAAQAARMTNQVVADILAGARIDPLAIYGQESRDAEAARDAARIAREGERELAARRSAARQAERDARDAARQAGRDAKRAERRARREAMAREGLRQAAAPSQADWARSTAAPMAQARIADRISAAQEEAELAALLRKAGR